MIIPRSSGRFMLKQNKKSYSELFRDVVFAFTYNAPFVLARVNYNVSFCCWKIRRH